MGYTPEEVKSVDPLQKIGASRLRKIPNPLIVDGEADPMDVLQGTHVNSAVIESDG